MNIENNHKLSKYFLLVVAFSVALFTFTVKAQDDSKALSELDKKLQDDLVEAKYCTRRIVNEICQDANDMIYEQLDKQKVKTACETKMNALCTIYRNERARRAIQQGLPPPTD